MDWSAAKALTRVQLQESKSAILILAKLVSNAHAPRETPAS